MVEQGFTTIDPTTDSGNEAPTRFTLSNLKNGCVNVIKSHLNRSTLIFQLFYFFFYAAFGSLFPLISIYFKQLGINGTQCGILSGVRSFIDCLATPFWNALAEKWKKGKSLLIISLVCSMALTLGMGFVKPTPEGCLVRIPYNKPNNKSLKYALTIIEPYRSSQYDDILQVSMSPTEALKVRNRHGQSPLYLNTKLLVPAPEPKQDVYGMEELGYSRQSSYHDPSHYPPGSLVMPLYSTVVYSQTKINQIFIVLLLLVIFSELLSCPAIPLVDALVAQKTKVQPSSLYGQQRMSGSIGWGLAMFFIGLALDNSSSFPDHPCLKPGWRERNYIVCFATYSVFLAFSLFTATQFSFVYEGEQESMYFKMVKDKMAKSLLGRTTKNRSKLVNEEDDDGEGWKPPNVPEEPSNEEILSKQLGIKIDEKSEAKSKSKLPAENLVEESYMATAQLKITKWAQAMHYFKQPQMLVFLFVIWFMGLGVGQVFTFLFWHIQEMGGSPTLFGIATVINHISEIVMFFFSTQIIEKIGHLRMLYIGLLCNVIRFLYVSWITNPWWILPFEFLQGITHAGVWVACCTYIMQAYPMDLRHTIQGFLKAVHYGLGRGLGSCLGGVVVSTYGSIVMFRSYGVASAAVLILFLLFNYLMPIPTTAAADKDSEKTGDLTDGTNEAVEYGQIPYEKRPTNVHFGGDVKHDYYTVQRNDL